MRVTDLVKLREEIVEELRDMLIGEDVKIVPNSNIQNDLGFDELDSVEMILRFEKKYNISIPDSLLDIYGGEVLVKNVYQVIKRQLLLKNIE